MRYGRDRHAEPFSASRRPRGKDKPRGVKIIARAVGSRSTRLDQFIE